MEFDQPLYRAPSLPRLNRRNISSPVIRGASAISSSTSLKPKLKTSFFSFRRQKSNVVDSISSQTASNPLEETNRILIEIQKQLALDFAMRIAEASDQNKKIKSAESKRRFGSKEDALEKVKTVGSIIKGKVDQVLAPIKSIFQKIIEFFSIILTGIVVNNAFKWLEKPENRQKLGEFFGFLAKHWKWIAATLGTVILLDVIAKVVLAVQGIMAAFALLTTPVGLGILGGIALAAAAISYRKQRDIEKEKQQESYVRAITGENYDTSVSGKPAQIIPYRPSGAKNTNSSILELIKTGMGAAFSKGGIVPNISFSADQNILKFSPGGDVPGKGSGTVDSVRALLAPGEYVVRTIATRLFRPFIADINENAGRRFDEFRQAIVGFLNFVTQKTNNEEKYSKILENFNKFLEREITKKNLRKGGGYGRRKPEFLEMANAQSMTSNVSNFNVSLNTQVKNESGAFGLAGVIKKPTILKEKTYNTIATNQKSSPQSSFIPITLPPIKSKPPEISTPTRTATDVPVISAVNMADPYRILTSTIYGIFV